MDASKFTTRSQEAINAAITAAAAGGHAQVEPVHLLAALLAPARGHHPPAARRPSARSPSAVEAAVRAELAKLPAATGSTVGGPSYSRGRDRGARPAPATSPRR